MKPIIRILLNFFHLDLTRNLKYDRLTRKIIAKTVKSDSICIDIGAHKGEILDLFLKYAPKGNHFAFEPIPKLYTNLIQKYAISCHIFPYALSDYIGTTTFYLVKNAPAFSGLLQRKYDIKNPEIDEIEVQLSTLDTIVADTGHITMIKIDVEGAELSVLKGAMKTLQQHKPYVIFECGLGASDYYGTKPEDVYNLFINGIGMKISRLQDWLKNEADEMTIDQFCNHFINNTEYYFLAHK
jgi:FkbM family methyltransferase